MTPNDFDIYDEIRAERLRQDDLHGGPAHDDTHGPHDWIVFICRHASLAAIRKQFNPVAFRKSMIVVAALAVAAAEWSDRYRKDVT